MTDPIQHDPPPFDWIRKNKLEALRRLSLWLALWLALCGVLLYIFGEVLARETEIQIGIWLLLAGFAVAVVYKLVSYIALVLAK